MFKKLLPFVVMAFVTACANNTPASHIHCCNQCQCCPSGECGTCCKDGACECCKDGACTSCADHSTAPKGSGEHCAACDKADREWKAEHGTMKH